MINFNDIENNKTGANTFIIKNDELNYFSSFQHGLRGRSSGRLL